MWILAGMFHSRRVQVRRNVCGSGSVTHIRAARHVRGVAVFSALFLLCLLQPAFKVQAAGEDVLPPHLIQSVTEQDMYEGMLSLGMLDCPVLEEADPEKACENVRDCVVRIHMGNAYGSGIIWNLTPDMVIIATNKHVLDYWQDVDSYVYFPQGYYMDARILGVSDRKDVGFLAVDNGQFTYRELESLRKASADMQVCEQLEQGSEMFCAGSGPEAGELLYYEGTVEDTRRYIADLDAYMLYGHGFARTGMSGGGMFDGYGHLIGMVTGGTLQNEVAGVLLDDLVEAYEQIVGNR